MKVVCIDPLTDPLWRLLLAHTQNCIFHSPGWMQVLAETYDLKIQAYLALDEHGMPLAGLPFVHIDDLVGERIVSLPFSDYCDPLVREQEQWNSLVAPLMAQRCPLVVRCLHNRVPLVDERFTVAKQAKWHGLDLRPDLESLWLRLPDSGKRAIKKARREGVIVRPAQNEEELRAFFLLHLRVRKQKYRLLAQPYRFFQRIWQHFLEPKQGCLLLAVYGEEIIGGVLFLEWQDTLYYKFNASTMADLGHRPNDLLIWEGIKYGKTKGYTSLDFGLSDQDQEGLIRFKRKFASEEKMISFLRYASGVPTTREKEVRGLLPLMTELFTEECVPDHITNRAGELLYRFFA